jgi:hypothetical protein
MEEENVIVLIIARVPQELGQDAHLQRVSHYGVYYQIHVIQDVYYLQK